MVSRFCQDIWQATGESYQAFIPFKINQQLIFPHDLLQESQNLDRKINELQKDIFIGTDSFFKPYLCTDGDPSRHIISRRRIALTAIGLITNDIDAQSYQLNDQSFSKAIDIGCRIKRFSLDSLATMAVAFDTAHEANTCEYRQTLAWVGGRSPVEAFYVAPPAKLVIPLMEDLCHFLNRDDIPASLQSALSYAQLMSIQPFNDANGRMARALVEVIMRRRGVIRHVSPPLYLYRLVDKQQTYILAISDFEKQNYAGFFNYWKQANHWGISKIKQIYRLRKKFQESYQQKLTTPLSKYHHIAKQMSDNLFHQPLVTAKLLELNFACSQEQALALLRTLEAKQIIIPTKHSPPNQMIWNAPSVFKLVDQFDQQLFSHQPDSVTHFQNNKLTNNNLLKK